ncbi:villin like protein quail [Cotesia typhae]|uniref:villin like protein quail n=1 Tax=Cotesia typhae TaxID=2053667 RepID=UPI003D69C4C7
MGSRKNQHDEHPSFSEDSGSDAFRNVPKNQSAFMVWKIQGLQAISVPRNKIGYFLSDSAYIIYAMSSKESGLSYPGIPMKEIKVSENIIRTIHFWIGRNCDSSISGAAALRTAELDAQVNATLLFRESEGRESSRFIGYFSRGIKIDYIDYLDNKPDILLYRVTGLSVPIINECDSIKWDHFSSTDVIIIDVKSHGVVFIWLGSSSSALDRRHAMKFIEERDCKNIDKKIIFVDDGYEQTLPDEEKKLFSSILDYKLRSVIPYNKSKIINIPAPVIKLYKCSEKSGKYKVVELKSGPIFRSDLISSSVFFIDRGEAGVWAWVGNNVNAREKLEAIRNARGFVKKKGYSSCVPVARAIENYEPKEMKKLLRPWEIIYNPVHILETSFDGDYMNERPKLAAECQLVDDGTGNLIIWRVCEENIVLVNKNNLKSLGFFYASVCYIIKYTYGSGRREKSIIYYWEGAHSINTDREAGLDFACKLAEETSGQIVKASQGREPPHLLQIYNGKLCILAGNHRDIPPKKYLVRVFGSTSYTSKAVERPLRASSLDSAGVFILFSESPVVWCGGKSTGDTREASRRLAPISAPLICEGNEDDEFWIQLEGKGEYGTEINNEVQQIDKHLYHCNVVNNIFVGNEILNLSQSSLLPEAAWLLDTATVIWIWLGSLCETSNIKKYIKDAGVFLHTHSSTRDRNTTISIVQQGKEPPTFIGLFENWNHNYLRDYRSFDEFRLSLDSSLIKKSKQNNNNCSNQLNFKFNTNNNNNNNNISVSNFDAYIKYPLKILKSEPDNLPSGVDVFKKEMHLTYDDFLIIFKMNPIEFNKLPVWKRQRLKQEAGLF